MRVSRFGKAALLVGLWLEALVAISPAAGDDNPGSGNRCSLRHMKGLYGILSTGTVVTPPPGSSIPAGPFATVGIMEVDKNGNAIVDLTRSFNGTITSETLPGMLTLNEDCTGTAVFGGVRTFNIVVVDQGNEIQFIQTNPGTVVTVVAKRQ